MADEIIVIAAKGDRVELLFLLPITPALDGQSNPIVATPSSTVPLLPDGVTRPTDAAQDTELDAGRMKWETFSYSVLSKQEYGPLIKTENKDGDGKLLSTTESKAVLDRIQETTVERDTFRKEQYANRLAVAQTEYDASVPVATDEIGGKLNAS